MKTRWISKLLLLMFFTICLAAVPAMAQTYKMTTPIAPGVAVPDKVETSIGTLNLNYGYPDDATTQKVYDNLDASRALQAYLLALPIVNQVGMRATLQGIRTGQSDGRDLGKPGGLQDRGTDGERQHHLQLHLA